MGFDEVRKELDTCVMVKKYAPKTLDDVLLDEFTMAKFKQYIADKNIPNILMSGAAGCGKTTCAKILAKEISKDEDGHSNYLFLNASSDTSVDVVRETIEPFCVSAATSDGTLKVVICDEVDGASPNFQNALKRNIERFYDRVRFIFTSNNPEKVEPAIAESRCQHYHFGDIPKKAIVTRVKHILTTENITFDGANVMALINSVGTDIRHIINEIDRLTLVKDGTKSLQKFTSTTERFAELINIIKSKKWTEACKFVGENDINVDTFLKHLMKPDIIKGLSAKNWPSIAVAVGEMAKNMKLGVDQSIAFGAGMAEIMQLVEG